MRNAKLRSFSEAPIHEEILKQRVLELHHVDRAGPVLQQVLTEALHQGLQKKRFIKTGPFYYSLKAKDLVARNRANRPDFERKLAYAPSIIHIGTFVSPTASEYCFSALNTAIKGIEAVIMRKYGNAYGIISSG